MAQLFSGERWFSTAKILTESVPCILIHSPISIVHLVTVSALSERKQQNFSHIFHRALHPLLSLSSISDLSPSLVLPCEEIILNWLKINHLVYQTSPQTLQLELGFPIDSRMLYTQSCLLSKLTSGIDVHLE
ncbi:hypothetical protein Pst134EA_000012 [Puccinia striiformis f. sp. tritici]|uniref:hypothetical protein n=1 Tax=Puccinia striiformis f. sp. tritici TaxID=168172 RepID=UPI00200755E0|nr:hypothetical protein Pst134EA_000012 [Puccinia striiformis f. sp. tritici]KAH9472926.1 hypothetical protein Pst134EA_000012 [Puccinia striiformis f. sp. tritici]